MVKKEISVQNKTGLHARPASEFVKKASLFTSHIIIEFENRTINAKSIVGILSAGIGFGSKLTLTAEGEDEEEAIKVLAQMIENKFDEE